MTGGGDSALRWLAVLSGAASFGEHAFAGAWTQAPGGSQQISTVSREAGDFGETWRGDYLAEYGWKGGWGGHLKLENQLRLDEGRDDRLSVEAGIKRSFAMGDRGAVAVQASLLAAESLAGPDCEGEGYEARAAWGTSRSFGARNGFVNVELARRERGAVCERTLVEAAAGVDIAPRWRTIVKAWSEHGDGADTAKAEASLLYETGPYSWGLGYRREISGAFQEDGVLLSLWRRY